MKPNDRVKILPTCWILTMLRAKPENSQYWNGLTGNSELTGVVTKVYKNGTVGVRVDQIRNRRCGDEVSSNREKKVFNFKASEVEVIAS